MKMARGNTVLRYNLSKYIDNNKNEKLVYM